MRTRRAVLGAVGAAVSAGCLGGPDDAGDPGGPGDDSDGTDDDPGQDGDENGDDGDGSPGGEDQPGDDPEPGEHASTYSVSVERVEDAQLYEAADLATVGEAAPAVRDAVAEATDDGYESSDPPESLRRFVARHDSVVADGQVYDLEAAFPQDRLVLEPAAYEDVDEADTVGADTFRQSVAATDAITEAANDSPYDSVWLPDRLQELVADYSYVTTTDTGRGADADYFDWRIERGVDDGPPYTLDASAVGEPDLPVTAYEELPDDAQAEFDAALGERHDVEEQPAIQDALGADRYVRYEAEPYRVAVAVAN